MTNAPALPLTNPQGRPHSTPASSHESQTLRDPVDNSVSINFTMGPMTTSTQFASEEQFSRHGFQILQQAHSASLQLAMMSTQMTVNPTSHSMGFQMMPGAQNMMPSIMSTTSPGATHTPAISAGASPGTRNQPALTAGSLMRTAAILLSCTENFCSEAVLQLSGFAKKLNASFTCIDCTLPTTQVAMPCFCCLWENVNLTHAQSQGINLPCCLSAPFGKLSNQANTCTDCKTVHAHV